MAAHSHYANRIATWLRKAAGGEAAAGLLLIAAAGAAMVCANSPLAQAYHDLFHHPLAWTPVAKLDTMHLWINDALMALFFFVIGLEIKREVIDGELSTPQRRRLPVLAAIAGMALPAAIFVVLVSGLAAGEPALLSGWAIPAATDIAFALGVLGLLGKRVPPSLRLFLLTVAIADDLGAIAIIALFYTASLQLAWLAGALTVLAAMAAVNRAGLTSGRIFVPLALALWFCVLHSGVHATIAGVLAAFTIPMRLNAGGDSLLLRMEHALAPWTGYLIVPLFGFANAGVALSGGAVRLDAPLPLAIAAGLLIGKQAGIFGAILIAEKSGFARRPLGASWVQVWGMALLCGIGFTMSLFIAGLAFPSRPDLIEEAKFGVLAGSLLSALLGYAVLRLARGKPA